MIQCLVLDEYGNQDIVLPIAKNIISKIKYDVNINYCSNSPCETYKEKQEEYDMFLFFSNFCHGIFSEYEDVSKRYNLNDIHDNFIIITFEMIDEEGKSYFRISFLREEYSEYSGKRFRSGQSFRSKDKTCANENFVTNISRYIHESLRRHFAKKYLEIENRQKARLLAQRKPLVKTEGQLDPNYIRTALELLGEQALRQSVDIEFVGLDDRQGGKHGGKDGLNQFRNVCEANPELIHVKILLLYDCDSNKPPEDISDLHIRMIAENSENSKVRVGIENLFPEYLFEPRFYKEGKPGKYGEPVVRFDKNGFCKWLCEERRNPEDFKNFVWIVQILKKFMGFSQ